MLGTRQDMDDIVAALAKIHANSGVPVMATMGAGKAG